MCPSGSEHGACRAMLCRPSATRNEARVTVKRKGSPPIVSGGKTERQALTASDFQNVDRSAPLELRILRSDAGGRTSHKKHHVAHLRIRVARRTDEMLGSYFRSTVWGCRGAPNGEREMRFLPLPIVFDGKRVGVRGSRPRRIDVENRRAPDIATRIWAPAFAGATDCW